MTEPNNTPIIKPEIVAPPSVSNLSVAQVGTGMFSVAMQVIMVVRFPADVPAGSPVVITAEWARRPIHLLDLAAKSATAGRALPVVYP